jgi:hypothetical protein
MFVLIGGSRNPHGLQMVKQKIGDYDDQKCYLKCFFNFHRLLGNPQLLKVQVSSVGVDHGVDGGGGGGWWGWGVVGVAVGSHKI